MPKRSITFRYLFWTWGFFLLVLSAVFWFATRQAEQVVVAEAEDRARASLSLARHLLRSRAPFATPDALSTFVDSLGPDMGFRLTYIVKGRVLGDSTVRAAGVPEMEDHANRPEVRAALANGYGQDVRRSRTLGRDMLYVAEPFSGAAGAPAGVVRLALPFSDLRGELGRLRETLLWVMALVFVAGGVVAYGLARSMSRSIREISNVVAAVGQGAYDRRIHIVPARDFGPLAEAVNVLAERVGSHVREIEERRERQEAILDGMAEGVAILDDRDRIVAANRALRTMFPQSGELLGRTPIETGMPLDLERCLSSSFVGTGRAGRYALPGGRVADVSVVPVAGHGQTRVATFHDVTEVAAMDRIFREFVIDASHRLRTPLTKVRGFAETARELAPTDVQGAGSALDVVLRGAGEMQEVIDDLLAAARERFAAASAAAPPPDALAVLKQALAGADSLLRARGVTARLVTSPEGPVAVPVAYQSLLDVFMAVLAQVPDGAAVAVSVTADETAVEIRFQGPSSLEAGTLGKTLAPGDGSVTWDGSARVVRLPRTAT